MTIYLNRSRSVRSALLGLLGWVLAAAWVVPSAVAKPADSAGDLRLDPHLVQQWRDQDPRLRSGCSAGLVGNGGQQGPGRVDSDGDGVDDRCDFFPEDPGRSGPFRTGTISTLDDSWRTVLLPGMYLHPVIIVGPPTENDSDPGIVQLDRVSPISFDVRFAEWSYLDGFHGAESVSYVVAEAGRYTMDDGSVWELGAFDILNTLRFRTASFSGPFPAAPAVFLTGQSSNGRDPYTARARSIGTAGFRVTLWEEEARNDGHQLESVGYLAVHSAQRSGFIAIDGTDVPYLLQGSEIDERSSPVLSRRLRLQEERSLDGEVLHRDEEIAVLALGRHLFGQDVSAIGMDTVTLRRTDPVQGVAMEWGTLDDVDDGWMRVPLAQGYTNPVVVVKPASSRDMDPGALHVRDVSPDSFEVRYAEWSYQDAAHGGERVFYMVADAGRHDLAGLSVEAGTTVADRTLDAGGWSEVALTAPFVGAPGVFAAVQSASDGVPTVTRVERLGSNTFRLSMQEEEGSLVDGRSPQTLGWIAVEMGRVVTDGGRSIEVLARRVDSQYRTVHFTPIRQGRFRTVVADVTSAKEIDPVSLRHASLGRNRVQLMLQEEQSADAEMTHVLEEVCLFVAE